MAILKISKKHHKRFNNPFPSAPTTIPNVQGSLFINSKSLSSQDQTFSIGNDFQLSWSIIYGGHISISHLSQKDRPVWSTISGKAFVSAAVVDTEIEESRGSFLVKDRDVHLICNHQTIDEIRMIDQSEVSVADFTFTEEMKFPTLLITGKLFNMSKKNKRFQKYGIEGNIQFESKGPFVYARYWVLFNQKNKHEVGFQVKIEKLNFGSSDKVSQEGSGVYKGFKKRLSSRKKRLGWFWYLSRPRGFVLVSSVEDESGEMEISKPKEFNRIWLSYASDENERFYGFGEQFSHMNFKGKRVPILVQEQGIGRGDQPITCAANLISYR